eukprot:7527827-Alexandrium_andersonii.AAC.1
MHPGTCEEVGEVVTIRVSPGGSAPPGPSPRSASGATATASRRRHRTQRAKRRGAHFSGARGTNYEVVSGPA